MKVARTVLNGESGSNAADLHNENEFDISNEAIIPISDYVEIHRNVVNNRIETGRFIQIKIR